jgi:ADP-glucose pyrophosphorylase
MAGRRVLGIVLAGGAGRRLVPQTVPNRLLPSAASTGWSTSRYADADAGARRAQVRLRQNKVPGTGEGDPGYWRDLNTLEAYFDAHMDPCAEHPAPSLYNDQWPILTRMPSAPPAKFVNAGRDADSAAWRSHSACSGSRCS